ncbi:MAG: DUF805 domain-containing protein [Gammaproteobacteria bacterium]|jgi:uncharacterized membrane protein YhaH (DUF805 family)|nr:DUF805 domain-containing protein [Gammaproteobacteria bacterium]MBT5204194.1 DUF805 domain-containing protein [Gammaproteobacteria bacterium]MBT6246708.1 DUF805 domain-containing protein [Gammaproteobacteria bacterium]
MNWYIEVLKKYAVFSGRARRKEYWFFVLFNVIISLVLTVIDAAMGTYDETVGTGILSGVYLLAIFIPSLAVAVRRLHDTGRSGWWNLIILIPLIGIIVLIVFLCLDGNAEENEYGASPKASVD